MPRGGIEPPTVCLQGSCSAIWATQACALSRGCPFEDLSLSHDLGGAECAPLRGWFHRALKNPHPKYETALRHEVSISRSIMHLHHLTSYLSYLYYRKKQNIVNPPEQEIFSCWVSILFSWLRHRTGKVLIYSLLVYKLTTYQTSPNYPPPVKSQYFVVL